MKSFMNPVRGWHVLVIFLAFFGVIVAVNVVFVSAAVRTHPGEDVPRSYYQGVNYNDTLDRRRTQEELGWSARINVAGETLLIEVLDGDGEPVNGLSLAGMLAHPTSTRSDCPLDFQPAGAGRYNADLACADRGEWQLRAQHDGEPPFELEQQIWLR